MIWLSKKPDTAHQNFSLPDIVLNHDKIYMRPPALQDKKPWIDLRTKNRDFLKPFEPTWPENCLTSEFYDRRLQRQILNWRHDLNRSFLIFKQRDNSLIGGMNINNIARGVAQYASLGYWIDKDHQGQGYMGEAMDLIIKYAFESVNLHRLHAASLPDNKRSINLILRHGFEEEGYAKNYLKIDGKWQDHILFGLCIEDWKSR